jgi:hypothetical protein
MQICSDDAFKLLGGAHLFSQLAQSSDSFVCELSSHFLIELLKKKDHEEYLTRLAKLVGRAQVDDDHEMLTNRFVRSKDFLILLYRQESNSHNYFTARCSSGLCSLLIPI